MNASKTNGLSRYESGVLCLGIVLVSCALIMLPWRDSCRGVEFMTFAPFGMRPAYPRLEWGTLVGVMMAVGVFVSGLILVRHLPLESAQRYWLVIGVAIAILTFLYLPWERSEHYLMPLTNNWLNVAEYQWFTRMPLSEVYPDAPSLGVNIGRMAVQLVGISIVTLAAITLSRSRNTRGKR